MSDYDELVQLRDALLRVEAIIDRMTADSAGGYGVTGWAEELREAIEGPRSGGSGAGGWHDHDCGAGIAYPHPAGTPHPRNQP